jgi:hypothetical protein
VLLETAVRSQIQRSRGYDAGVDLIDRQARMIDDQGAKSAPDDNSAMSGATA